MATKSKIVETAFRFGSGRYIQESGAAGRLAEELARLGCCNPFVIGGKTYEGNFLLRDALVGGTSTAQLSINIEGEVSKNVEVKLLPF